MGVPHPPGNPLFMIMLRVSSILFLFFKDIGYRMNFLVVLFSAGTAAIMYLTVVESDYLLLRYSGQFMEKNHHLCWWSCGWTVFCYRQHLLV